MRAAQVAQAPLVDQRVMADYVQRLPAGSRVRVEQTHRRIVPRHADEDDAAAAIVVQKNTRVPEPPVEVPMASIARITLDNPTGSSGKAIGIGIAAGVGITFAFFAILAAALGD